MMWEYNQTINSNELYHYGVPGMKWGVHRSSASKISSWNRKKTKLNKKITKQENKQTKLKKKLDKQTISTAERVAKLMNESARLRNKSYTGFFMTKSKGDKLRYKADKMEAQANAYKAQIEGTKLRIEKTNSLIRKYNTKISKLDTKIKEEGKKKVDSIINKKK